MEEKKYYRPQELKKLGYPAERILEKCRSGEIGRKSCDSRRGFHYLVTIEEAERCLTR